MVFYTEAYQRYAKELSSPKYNPLSVEKERQLLQSWGEGDGRSFDLLVYAHLRFVVYLLKDFSIPSTVDVMDIIQEGNEGLIEGLKRFDYKRYSCKISTYSVFWIRFFISKSLTSQVNFHSLFPILSEIPSLLLTEESVDNEDVSEIAQYAAKEIINESFKQLESRELFVLTSFYGLQSPYKPKTLEEIGSMLCISLERVRQLRVSALKKISKKSISDIVFD